MTQFLKDFVAGMSVEIVKKFDNKILLPDMETPQSTVSYLTAVASSHPHMTMV